MNTANLLIESRAKTYGKAAAWLMPPLLVLAFASVFLLPKLETIWQEAGFSAAFAITALRAAYALTHNFPLIAVVVVAGVVLLEWRSAHWPRYRRASVGVAAFITNVTVLVFMTAMLMSAVLAAPALMRLK